MKTAATCGRSAGTAFPSRRSRPGSPPRGGWRAAGPARAAHGSARASSSASIIRGSSRRAVVARTDRSRAAGRLPRRRRDVADQRLGLAHQLDDLRRGQALGHGDRWWTTWPDAAGRPARAIEACAGISYSPAFSGLGRAGHRATRNSSGERMTPAAFSAAAMVTGPAPRRITTFVVSPSGPWRHRASDVAKEQRTAHQGRRTGR